MIESVSSNHETEFMTLSIGNGALPNIEAAKHLSLIKALNKLKHHAMGKVNFTIDSEGKHILFFYTNAGQRNPKTISCFDVQVSCEKCKQAVEAL